jgi:hypothetical protein
MFLILSSFRSSKCAFFNIGIIYSDLMKEKQGLIKNYFFVQITLVIYFLWP